MKNLVLFAGMGSLLLSIVALLRSVPLGQSPPQFNVPDNVDIVRLRAKLLPAGNVPVSKPEDEASIVDFEVDPEHIPEIMRWLRPSTYQAQPYLDDPIGEIKIQSKGSKFKALDITLQLFWSGAGPVLFTRDGIHYYFGNWWCGMDGGGGIRRAIVNAHADPADK